MAEQKKYICIERFWEDGAQFEIGKTITGLNEKRIEQLKGKYVEVDIFAEKIIKSKKEMEARLASIGM